MLTVPQIIEQVFEKWGAAVSEKVGDGYSMENSTTVTELPYATMFFQGLPTGGADLQGGEAAVSPTLQVDIYTNGQRALSEAYNIDELSHSSLLEMGFRRSYGPELIQSTDPSIKRLVSRYTRLIGYGETLD